MGIIGKQVLYVGNESALVQGEANHLEFKLKQAESLLAFTKKQLKVTQADLRSACQYQTLSLGKLGMLSQMTRLRRQQAREPYLREWKSNLAQSQQVTLCLKRGCLLRALARIKVNTIQNELNDTEVALTISNGRIKTLAKRAQSMEMGDIEDEVQRLTEENQALQQNLSQLTTQQESSAEAAKLDSEDANKQGDDLLRLTEANKGLLQDLMDAQRELLLLKETSGDEIAKLAKENEVIKKVLMAT